ncbi:liver-expressed antimicrobial peptide 2-like [Rhincodon typus]|uniref:liver-expressed antimicrobial peptide 2-like n=1 Tax=Rhincodon typus TaxID=259920 RepID=UPI00202FFA3C|nr:liver-expressed antimicrobial peptide 2-like [Rhincodon typus]
MRAKLNKVLAVAGMLLLISTMTVQLAPVSDNQKPLVQRIKRSMLWRWITQRPNGATCRVDAECITNYCAIQDTISICSLQTFSA